MVGIWSVITQGANSGGRSDALRALVWPLAILFAGFLYLCTHAAPNFAIYGVGILFVVVLIVYLVFFAFFAVRDPNMLRSERYNIGKMAIERGIYGDDLKGVLKISDNTQDADRNVIEGKSK